MRVHARPHPGPWWDHVLRPRWDHRRLLRHRHCCSARSCLAGGSEFIGCSVQCFWPGDHHYSFLCCFVFSICDLAFAETYSYVFVLELNEKGNICLWFDLLPLQNVCCMCTFLKLKKLYILFFLLQKGCLSTTTLYDHFAIDTCRPFLFVMSS